MRFLPVVALLACACVHRAGGPSAPLATTNAEGDPAPLPSLGCRPGAERGHAGLRTITSLGRTRYFTLRVPDGAAVEKPAPLVLNFHGLLQPAPIQEIFSGMTEGTSARGWVAAYPHGIGKSWNAGACCGRARDDGIDDVRFVRALVSELGKELCLDRRRIYATGMSNGGIFSYRLACEASDLIAAIAPVAAVEAVPKCTPRRPVPVLAFNGTSDYLVSYAGSLFSRLGGLPSVPDTVSRWASRNACVGPMRPLWKSGDSRCEAGSGCREETVLCTVDGGGHTWPGGMIVPYLGKTTGDLDATATMLEWFAHQAIR